MPQGVVDDLEAIEIEENDRALAFVSSSLLDCVAEQFAEQRTIGQPSQLVVSREISDALLGISSSGDVFDDRYVVEQRAICSAPHRARDANPKRGAVVTQIALFCRQRIDLACVKSLAVGVRDANIVRMRDLPHSELPQLLARIAQHVPELLVGPDEPAFLAYMRYANGCELDGARVANLALAQPILEGAPLCDVVDSTDDRCGLTILV